MKKLAKDIMNRRLETIPEDASVYDAIERMIDKRIRSLLVVPKGSNTDYGVVTVRNIIFKVIALKKDPHQVKIGEISSKPIVCVYEETPVEEILDLMSRNNFARIFIKNKEERIVGVVSFFDVLTHVLVEKAKK